MAFPVPEEHGEFCLQVRTLDRFQADPGTGEQPLLQSGDNVLFLKTAWRAEEPSGRSASA